MTKKYRLLDGDNNGLYRIVALRDIPRCGVEAGDEGGRVGGGHNLSQEGDCWIRYNTVVYDNAHVCDNAIVYNNAHVCGNPYAQTKVGDDAIINGTTCLGSGTWETTPKVIHGSAYDVIYSDKQIAIGCECHALEWWKKHGLEVAEEDNFSPKQIEEYREHLDAIGKEYADDKEVQT